MNGILGKTQPAMGGAGPSKGGRAVPATTTVGKTQEGNSYKSAIIKGIDIPITKGYDYGNHNVRYKGDILGNNARNNGTGELCVQFKLQLSPSGRWEVTESKVLDQEVAKIGLVITTWPNVETHKGMLGHRHKEEKKHEA
jgi:hypothetical protein